MAVQKPRSRIISIRLSEEEFLTLRQLSAISGARSVSAFTRDAMHVVLDGANRDEVLGLRMQELHALLKRIDRRIGEMAARLSVSEVRR
jgi:hypothetical protein